jgi:NADPH-dependent ferric siderophore reductase
MSETSPTVESAAADDDPVAAELVAMAPSLLPALNTDFADSVLLIGRVLGERREATAARVVALDRQGIDMVVSDPEGDHGHRFAFAAPVAGASQVTNELISLVLTARARSGEDGTTSAELLAREMTSIRTFVTSVVAVEDIHPHLRQITFGGGDLATFTPLGPDTFLYLLLPPPGRDELTIDQTFTWSAYEAMPESERPVGAYYTLRRWRPEQQELDMLCVLHGDTGPASAWAAQAKPGDPVALWGPRTAYEPPADTDWYLLVADETGLPAVAAIIESLPPGTPVRVVAEADNPDERQELPEARGVEVTWLYRDGAPAGTITDRVAEAVRTLTWPAGTPYVWGGGESRAMTAVRRHVRHEVGLPRERVSLVAYWRHAAHADDPEDPEE